MHHIECSLEPDEYKEMVQTVRQGFNIQEVVEKLGAEAFQSNFGMSEMEESFLVKNTYGADYIKGKTEL